MDNGERNADNVKSTLVERLREGAIQTPRRWSGDCGEMSTVDEIATDELMVKAADEIEQLEAKYYDLIYAVSQKWPNETRHETAFRYIRSTEWFDNFMKITETPIMDSAVQTSMQSTYLEGCKFERENQRLLEREKMCETMDKAEKLALIRALQEIRDAVGLLGDGVSPREIVAAVISLSNA